jgi:8-oxo-dGTP pyrophosphatase MutT (NUDIX family)
MEEDDSIIDTVIRETEEEIGITINKKDLQLVTTSDRRE